MKIKAKLTLSLLFVLLTTACLLWLSYNQLSHEQSQLQAAFKKEQQEFAQSHLDQFILDTQKIHNNLSRHLVEHFPLNQTYFNNLLSVLRYDDLLPIKLIIFDVETRTFNQANKKPIVKDKSHGLDNIIVSQMATPKDMIKITSHHDIPSLIFSHGVKKNNNLIAINFCILPLDETLLTYLQKQTGIDYAFTFGPNTYTSDALKKNTITKELSWPIDSEELSSNIQFYPNQQTTFSSDWLLQISIIVTIVLILFLLILASKLLSQLSGSLFQLEQLFSHPVPSEQIIGQLKNCQLIPELEPLKSNIEKTLNRNQNDIQIVRQELSQIEKKYNSLTSETDKVKNQLNQAVSAPKTKSEFLSRMGDEVTTPMKTLTSMLNLLNEYPLSEEPKELLSIAQRASGSLVDNLQNIMDFSKLEAGLLPLHNSHFNVRELLDEISDEYRGHAEAKGLIFNVNASPETPKTFFNDPKRTRQIIKNLIGNAIRFTKEGEVSIFTDFMLQDSEPYLRFTIKDSGIGIPQDAQKSLFDSFDKRSRLTNSSFAGRLRLIVSKKLAELMGGEIGVNSALNQGSRFWFTIASKQIDHP